MKTKIITLTFLLFMSIASVFAQDRTTVTANNREISDNLDLRAVASIFGDSKDLEDFEQRLNNPEVPISNLDLNNDNQVDYLRVIETLEGNTHLIVIQSVLGRDLYQDVATVEVEKDKNNKVQVQVVGNVYMYGANYIYEPVYSFTPVIYNTFWITNYRPYWSTWYWGYYPSYYYAWHPFPIFRYRNHIGLHINIHHHYNYVNVRRSQTVYNSYYNSGRRGSAYETQYPNRSFASRNTSYANRYELDKTRNIRTVAQRGELANSRATLSGRDNAANLVRNERTNTFSTRNEAVRNERTNDAVRSNNATRDKSITRSESATRENNSIKTERAELPRNTSVRDFNTTRNNTVKVENTRRNESTRTITPRTESSSRIETPRSSGDRNFSESRSSSSSRSQGNAGSNRRG